MEYQTTYSEQKERIALFWNEYFNVGRVCVCAMKIRRLSSSGGPSGSFVPAAQNKKYTQNTNVREGNHEAVAIHAEK